MISLSNMQEKPAITAFPIQEALQKRWSPRAFDSKPLTKEEFFQCLKPLDGHVWIQ